MTFSCLELVLQRLLTVVGDNFLRVLLFYFNIFKYFQASTEPIYSALQLLKEDRFRYKRGQIPVYKGTDSGNYVKKFTMSHNYAKNDLTRR